MVIIKYVCNCHPELRADRDIDLPSEEREVEVSKDKTCVHCGYYAKKVRIEPPPPPRPPRVLSPKIPGGYVRIKRGRHAGVVRLSNGKQKQIGVFDTNREATEAVKQYLEKLGRLFPGFKVR